MENPLLQGRNCHVQCFRLSLQKKMFYEVRDIREILPPHPLQASGSWATSAASAAPSGPPWRPATSSPRSTTSDMSTPQSSASQVKDETSITKKRKNGKVYKILKKKNNVSGIIVFNWWSKEWRGLSKKEEKEWPTWKNILVLVLCCELGPLGSQCFSCMYFTSSPPSPSPKAVCTPRFG